MQTNSVFIKFLLVCVFCLTLPTLSVGQSKGDTARKVIQLSGIAVDGDSLTPLPYVAIIIRNSERGVYSNQSGYFAIVVQERDTVDFYALGYHKASFILADTFSTNQYVLVQALTSDTIVLSTATIYPWPSKEQFKNAFLATEVATDDMERARANLSVTEMERIGRNVGMDAGMVYSSTVQQQTARNYYAGQKPPNNLLNPVAWSRFIQSVQNGDLKGH